MPTSLPERDPGATGSRKRESFTERTWLGWTLLVPLTLVVLTAKLPPELVLPALSIILVITGLALAALTLLLGGEWAQTRDIAGAIVLAGFAASMLADVPEALRALADLEENMRGSRPAS